MTEEDERPLLRSFTADSAMQGFLKQTLRTIRDNAPDEAVRESVEDVLEGRRSLYDIFGDEEFTEAVWSGVDQGLDAVLELDEAELERLAADGESLFDPSACREVAVDPGP